MNYMKTLGPFLVISLTFVLLFFTTSAANAWTVDTTVQWRDNTDNLAYAGGTSIWDGKLQLIGENALRAYLFRENSGFNLHDFTTDNQDGSIENDPVWTSGYKDMPDTIGLSYENDWVVLPSLPELDNTTDEYTVIVVSKHESVGDGDVDSEISLTLNNGIILRDNGSNYYYFKQYDGTAFQNIWTSITDNVWNMWTQRYDGQVMDAFKDNNWVDNLSISYDNEGTDTHALGAAEPAYDLNFLDGVQCLALIYDVAISDNKIFGIYDRLERIGYMDNLSSGEWASKWHDNGRRATVDSIDITASIGAGENVTAIVSVNDDNILDGTEDNTKINVLDGENTYPIGSTGRYVRVKFILETDNTAYSPSVDNFQINTSSAWQLIESWSGIVSTPGWNLIESWTGTVQAPAEWQLFESWSGTIQAPAQWQMIESWSGTVSASAEWRMIDSWTGTVSVPGWQMVESWSGTVSAPVGWQLIESWTGMASTSAQWSLIDSWSGTVSASAEWQLTESWAGVVQAPLPEWQLIGSWTGVVSAPIEWNLVESWTDTISTSVQWSPIESGSGTVSAPVEWQLVDSWTGTSEAPSNWSRPDSWSGSISFFRPPKADFTSTLEDPVLWNKYTFTDNSIPSSGENIENIMWDFDNDGNWDAYGAEVTWTFKSGPDNYLVTLKVIDSSEKSDTFKETVEVSRVAPIPETEEPASEGRFPDLLVQISLIIAILALAIATYVSVRPSI